MRTVCVGMKVGWAERNAVTAELPRNIVLVALLAWVCAVQAATTPSDGGLLFSLYDVFITQGVNGAAGTTLGIGAIVFAAFSMFRSWLAVALGIAIATILFQAEAIATVLGATV